MTIEVTAKKADEAIKKGLEQLGANLDDVKVEVIDAGGIFRKAKVRLTVDDPEPEKPEAVEKPEKSEQKATAEKPEKSEKIEHNAAETKTSEKAEKAEKAEKPEKAEKTAKENKPVKAEKAEKPKKEGLPKRAEKSEKAEIAETAEDSADRDGACAETGKAETAENGARAKKSKKTEKSAKPDKPADPEKKEKVADGGEEHAAGSEEHKRAKEAAYENALELVRETVKLMGFEAQVERDPNCAENIVITADAGDDSLLIGRHGDTLAALSFIAETVSRAEKNHISVVVDCNGYRARRAATIEQMAKRRANEAVAKNRRIKLEPMGRIDRRTVHNALSGDDRVTTLSEGKEPHRFVVIAPKQA